MRNKQPLHLTVAFFLIWTMGFVLSSCATQPTQTSKPTSEETLEVEEELVYLPNAEELIEQAREAVTLAESQQLLLQAALLFLEENAYQQAGALLIHLDPELLPYPQNHQLRLAFAHFYAYLNDWEQVRYYTLDLQQHLSQRHERIQALQLEYQWHVQQQDHLQAALRLIELGHYQTEQEDNTLRIWSHLSQVPAQQWRDPPKTHDATVYGWYQLLSTLTQVFYQEQSLAATELWHVLEQWQQQFPQHPAHRVVDSFYHDSSMITRIKKVAVLLPLTGPLAKQGNAVRYGILAKAMEQQEYELHFFDTHLLDFHHIAEQLHELDIQYVIGPLDKDAVHEFAKVESVNWLQLALNEGPTPASKSRHAVYYALDLTSETQAAATDLRHKGYQHILVFAPHTQRGRQLAQTFEQTWQKKQTQQTIQVSYYKSSADIQDSVRKHLGVSASLQREQRLAALEPKKELSMEFRTRQDVDAIYLVGDATQARLLKPYIDSSISSFWQPIPVYANSTIHDQTTAKQHADLKGIYFTDAPWLLTTPTAKDRAYNLYSSIYQWSFNEQRLSAMGYDSLHLAPQLAAMARLPGYTQQGLTGTLFVYEQKLERRLPWAIFEQDTVTAIPNK